MKENNKNSRMIQIIDRKYCQPRKSLNLNGMRLSVQDINYITAKYKGLIDSLYISETNINNQGYSAFTSLFQQLELIDLGYAKLEVPALEIISSARMASLNTLILDHNSIGSQGVNLLVKSYCPSLQRLALNQNDIGLEGVRNISKTYWPRLQQIQMKSNYIKNQQALYFVCTDWKLLTQMKLNKNQMEGIGCLALCTHNWKSIKNLIIYSNQVSGYFMENIPPIFNKSHIN